MTTQTPGRHRAPEQPASEYPPRRRSQLPVIALTTGLVLALVTVTAIAGHATPAAQPAAEPATSATLSTAPPTTSAPSGAPMIVLHVEQTEFGQAATGCAKPSCAASAVAGDTIRPGMWSTTGGAACHWSRNAGASWETGGDPRMPITVHLGNGARFDEFGCAPWTLYRAD